MRLFQSRSRPLVAAPKIAAAEASHDDNAWHVHETPQNQLGKGALEIISNNTNPFRHNQLI
jgi:hypothetical protein